MASDRLTGERVHSRRRAIIAGGLRAGASAVGLVVLYYLLPLTHASPELAAGVLLLGLAVFVALVVFQVRAIDVAPFPVVRAIEALATSVPLFLLLFAGTYVVLAARSAGNFGGPLTHTDALYFTVTVFTTVGFGDITAKSETARLVVTGQMIADVVVIGIAIKAIIGTAQKHR
jgi:hypothetical protein